MAKTKTKNVISDMSQKKKALPEVKKTPSKVTTILLNKNEKRCYKCPNYKKRKGNKFPCRNPVTFVEDVPASPALSTACEKMPSVRKEPKVRNTEVKKRINFDQQERTQGEQSLSQRYGNLCPGQLTQR